MVDQLKLAEIFTPTARKRRQQLDDEGMRIAHYTTAESAYKILDSQSLWMRNALNMDDFREIQHGHDLLLEYFSDPSKHKWLMEILNRCCGEAGKTAIDIFGRHYQDLKRFTYITCFSQHEKEHDAHGRLSMWRAFGKGSAGIAIVLNPPRRDIAAPLQAFLVPVMYFTKTDLWNELDSIFNNIAANETLLKDVPQDQIYKWVFTMLVALVTSLKHQGFEEEKEWRLLHVPKTYPSEFVPESNQVIGGVPQLIRKIDLKNNPENGIEGISIRELVERVIIGPTQFGGAIFDSISKLLANAGVQNAEQKVFFSNIPIRT